MKRALLVLLLAAGVARAQKLSPEEIDRCHTLDLTPGALLEPASSGGLSTPIPWSEFVVEGKLIKSDSPATVHALFAPTMTSLQTTLSDDKWPEVAQTTARFGYQLVGHELVGSKLVLRVEPLPVVRKVVVAVNQSLGSIFRKLLDEEIRRRMHLRVGGYLPGDSFRRKCALQEESTRLEEFLRDEGYFDAEVDIPTPTIEEGAIKLRVDVDQGDEYTVRRVTIAQQGGADPAQVEPLAIPESEIKAVFSQHKRSCILGLCLSSDRFTRTQMQEDVQHVRDMFQNRGYPAVRVQAQPTPLKESKHVNLSITIDQRRQVVVEFRGHNPDAVSNDALRKQLTFNEAGTADDVEAAQSARALTTFLQGRGYFDARVTWSRDRIDTGATGFDRLTFWLDLGRQRTVSSVKFTGNAAPGFAQADLEKVVVTKRPTQSVASTLFGESSAATSEQLASDVERVKAAYRRGGYRDAQVSVAASVEPNAVGKAALTAPLVQSGLGGDLHVKFSIAEGQPTLLTRVEIVHAEADKNVRDVTCELILKELAAELAPSTDPQASAGIATRADKSRCVAVAPHLLLREDEVRGTRDKLRDWLYKIGRTRAEVEVELCSGEAAPGGDCTPLATTDHRAVARYRLRHLRPLTIGKIVVRGNFKTKSWIIKGELTRAGVKEGKPLTTEALADGARRLRNTGLFSAVNIEMPDLTENQSPVVNAIVRVEERYDYHADLSAEGGYSSLNGVFGGLTWRQLNLVGRGISLTVNGTVGSKIQSGEATLRFPQLLIRHLFDVEVTALSRGQDTERFGFLRTNGLTVGIANRYATPRKSDTQPAHSWGWSVHYDYRDRNRNVFAVRPIGADQDDSQAPVETRTGSIGGTIDYDARVDRKGILSPFTPEAGYWLEASASFAAPFLSLDRGSDTFIKISAAASKFYSPRENIVIRGDLRFDEGFPLGGAVLLPEVERYFAGGDSTVRGYEDDKLFTEIVQVGVPPLSNISQIRVIPAGGNIRVLASVDAQVRIWSYFAGAVFSDAGMITNQWSTVTPDAIRPSVGTGLRFVTPFGIGAAEYAVPLRVHLGDDPRGRWHVYFAARVQF